MSYRFNHFMVIPEALKYYTENVATILISLPEVQAVHFKPYNYLALLLHSLI